MPSSTTIEVSARLPPKGTNSPIDVTDLGMTMEVRPVQKLRARSPIAVTLWGIVKDDKPLQKAKASASIEVIVFGRVTAFRFLHM